MFPNIHILTFKFTIYMFSRLTDVAISNEEENCPKQKSRTADPRGGVFPWVTLGTALRVFFIALIHRCLSFLHSRRVPNPAGNARHLFGKPPSTLLICAEFTADVCNAPHFIWTVISQLCCQFITHQNSGNWRRCLGMFVCRRAEIKNGNSSKVVLCNCNKILTANKRITPNYFRDLDMHGT